MSKQTQEDLTEITKLVLHIGGLVESAIDRSLVALLDRDAKLAREVIEGDSVVDNLENEVEEKCLEVLVMRQPVARDLRYITGIMKINSDLEASPERVNEDCWDKGWMIAIKPEDPKAVEALLDAKTYRDHIAALEH